MCVAAAAMQRFPRNLDNCTSVTEELSFPTVCLSLQKLCCQEQELKG